MGEVFAFISGLYFRGKLTYARRFARPVGGIPAILVISPCEGLRVEEEPLTLARLRRWGQHDVSLDNPDYLEPLRRHADALAQALAGDEVTRVVLLGSVADDKYVVPLAEAFGPRLLFPPDFIGRGDMSRGALLLRSARSDAELSYQTLVGARLTGPRAPRLPPRAPKSSAARRRSAGRT